MLKLKSSFYLFSSIFLRSFSFLVIKYSSMATGIQIYLLLCLAFIFIIARAFTWQKVLQITPLSIAYPFTSLVQVLILIYAAFLFNEQVEFHHILGIVVMLSGLLLISKG